MKQKTSPCLTTTRRKTPQDKKKTAIDPNWLYYLREAERNEKQVINR